MFKRDVKSMSDKQKTIVVALVLAVVTAGVYQRACNNDFINFDDDLYVTENSNVQAGLSWEGIKWAFTTTQAYNWHPLTWLSHMVDCQLYGLNPAGHHFTNMLFHTANSVLLFLVFKLMTGCLWRSALVAGFFAFHPLHVESVVWVSERKDVLSTFFWILTMWFYGRYALRPSFGRYFPAVLSLTLGLMAKQMLVTLPLILLVLDYWPLERFTLDAGRQNKGKNRFRTSSLRHCLVEKLPLLALSVIASLVVFLVQLKATLVKSPVAIPVIYRLGNAVVAYAGYIAKMFLPVGLGVLYPHPGVSLRLLVVAVSGLLLLCISIVIITAGRRRRWLVAGWLWYLGTLVPVIGLVQVGLQAMADRYTYVPLTGLSIIIVWGAGELVGKLRYRKIVAAAAVGMVLTAWGVLTWVQLGHWKNSIVLFEHTVAVTRNNDILHYNLGVLFLEQNNTEQAIKHWREAIKIKAGQPTIHKNLAILLARQGQLEAAIEHYRQALRYRPADAAAQKGLKNLLERRKKVDTSHR